MQNPSTTRRAAHVALRQLRIATCSGGVSANDNGKSFQEVVLARMLDYGMREWAPKTFKGVDTSDAVALLQRAYDKDGALGAQFLFNGLVIPQLTVTGHYKRVGATSSARRDLVAVFEDARYRAGVVTPLNMHFELKSQDSSGSADQKAPGLPTELVAGGADYCFIVWEGIGAVPGAHQAVHQAALKNEATLTYMNALTDDPSIKPCTGQLFYASSTSEMLAQTNAILEAEANGRVFTYQEWRLAHPFINPSDVKTAARKKKERREDKEAAGREVSALIKSSL